MMGNMMRGEPAQGNVNTDNSDSALKGSDDDMLVVMQDYPSSDITEPIFREAYWWRVRSVQTGKENYIPNSHVAKVYHGWLFEGVERQKAEELLRLPANRVGSFMVRESSKEKGVYSLSVKHRSIKHYRIFRLDNSWYYISPRLTFQCLEDMINHYSDCADGLCCVLTSPCLSGTVPSLDAAPQAPPVVMRRNFDWKKVDRRELVCTGSHSGTDNRDSMVSYGVRNSLTAYLSFSGGQDPAQEKTNSRKKKSKSVYVPPGTNLANLDYEEEF
ncbi:src like adaptor 1a isoform X2 [Centroberyx affinis]|uniref:src like adaptor 1a isoform X2 n=1 Tax=Centroberyx affinis TaxID=166261 RepID=UPI003A5C6DBD